MSLLKPMASSPGYLKAGLLGFSGAGKTFTAVELAIGTRAHFQLAGPLAMFDTEGGSDYLRERVQKATGTEMLGLKSRSFDDLLAMAKECVGAGVAVLVVDSVTHVWRELCESYLTKVNAALKARGKGRRQDALEFSDWGPIKARWNEWTDLYLNAPLHIVICGRAGFEYDFEENAKGKKELVKTGIKMKAEGEFGFEPSLLVEMERQMDLDSRQIIRKATVLKDRFDVIDGKSEANPTFEFFKPHIARLIPAGHTEIDLAAKSQFEDGDDVRRRALLASIQSELYGFVPGKTEADKEKRLALLERHLGTKQWGAVKDRLDIARIELGLRSLREDLAQPAKQPEPEPEPEAPPAAAAGAS